MKLTELLEGLTPTPVPEVEVRAVTQDSRAVGPNDVFVAIRGGSADGHAFLDRIKTLAVVVEDPSHLRPDFAGAVVVVPDTRRALETLARRFYREPARELACVGVTGTNGKTTVTYMVEAILTAHGWPTGVLGTIDHHLGERRWPSALTTPDALTLQRRLRDFVDGGAKAAAFEISSHALHQSRARGLPLRVGIFTNFTRDHLDYHGDMDQYFAAKQLMFTEVLIAGGFAILNADDARVRACAVRDGVTRWRFGQATEAEFRFELRAQTLAGSQFDVTTPVGKIAIELPCTGTHNVANAVAALAAGVALGVPLDTAAGALAEFYGAPGRLERVPDPRGRFIFVDYAHTDDALSTVLAALNGARKSPAKLITVFGCGGDRDRGKRPLMAKAAARFSDVLILTSDNPRTEDPERILSEIAAGVPNAWRGELAIVTDRRQALGRALQTAREGDVILVAGKGHEDYQIVGHERRPFSDQRVLRELRGI